MARQPFIWGALRCIGLIARALPHTAALRMGSAAGSLVARLSSERAARAEARAVRALGATQEEARRIVRGAYRHFGMAAIEFIRLPKMAGRLEDLIEIRGEEELEHALSLGRGAIFLSAHIGNWEYGAALLAQRGYQMNAIGAEQRDDRITAEIARIRRAAGVSPVEKGSGLRAAIECLKRREILAVLLDQDAREAGVVADLLGLPASTPTGPIRLARKFGAPMLPVRAVRGAKLGRLIMTIEPPLDLGESDEDAARACNDAISRWIRETPEQWMWMYPRWATTLGDR